MDHPLSVCWILAAYSFIDSGLYSGPEDKLNAWVWTVLDGGGQFCMVVVRTMLHGFGQRCMVVEWTVKRVCVDRKSVV